MTMVSSSGKSNKKENNDAPQQLAVSHSKATNSNDADGLRKKPSEEKNFKKKSRKTKRRNTAMVDSKNSLPESDCRQIASKRRKLTDTKSNVNRAMLESALSQPTERMEEDIDDDDDDEDLLAAAAMWAGDISDVPREPVVRPIRNEKAKKEKKTVFDKDRIPHPNTHDVSELRSYSLHITQLPFDSTEMDLRKFFTEQGCALASIRLVYDHDIQGRRTVFRGVAFVDLLDQASYERALKLNHKASIRSRKLNIRPTRSKQELANIVSRKKGLIHERILQQRVGEADGSTPPKSKKTKTDAKGKQKDISSNKKETKVKEKRVDKEGKPIKITKKERNRRAAIIMGLQTKKKG
jgi:hypothetical protein